MKVTPTALPDVLVLEPRVFTDARGHFLESWNERAFEAATGLRPRFVQDNQSHSVHGVLRGLHYQVQQPQGKLVWATRGATFSVAVDLRRSSPTFGRWAAVELGGDDHRQLWVPPGFAHGFLVLGESADLSYKATDFYAPEHERCILWNDPDLAIPWPLQGEPLLSPRDSEGTPLRSAETYA
jgi:dTDP-4-dehydrorhamnose 3,5-epimerase